MVEWGKLGNLGNRNKGIPITAGQMSELDSPIGNVRVFAAGQTIADISEENLPSNCAHSGPSIIVKSRGYVEFEYYERPFTHKNEIWSYSFKDRKIGKYVFYYLTTKTDLFRRKAKANSVKLPQLCVADTDNYLIPIPSISEQQRIVDILDTFTSSIDNLKQQIAQRRKQYEYFRDNLLDLERKEGVEMKPIGSVCITTTPPKKIATKDYQIQGSFPIIDQGQQTIVGYTDDESALLPDEEYVLFGDHTRFVKYYKGKFAQGADGLKILKAKDFILSRFFYYSLLNINVPSRGYSRHWSIAKELQIPVPPINEQQRIVSMLDTFEDSIRNLEEQLKLREKQYEYYRNKLLTFE